MGEGLARGFFEIFVFLGRLSLAGVAGGCVIVVVPLFLFLQRADSKTGNIPLAKTMLIVLVSIFGGLFVINLLVNFLIQTP